MIKKNYYSVFQRRNENSGHNFQKVVQHNTELEFERFLRSTPDRVSVTVNDSTKKIDMAFIIEKEDEIRNRRFALCRKSDKVKVGDFIYWDGTVWLAFMKVKHTIDAYDKLEILECRHTLKWIDEDGAVQQQPVFLVAQADAKIKANFRLWNDMITPQPNTFTEIITSATKIRLGQKFLFDDTAWFVVESDYLSVKNIVYLSLTEDKINIFTDDQSHELADIADLHKTQLEVPSATVELKVGEEYLLSNKVYTNGLLNSNELVQAEILDGNDFITLEGLKITAREIGTSTVRVSLVDNEDVQKNVVFAVRENAQANIEYLFRGDASIKWGRSKNYSISKIVNGVETTIPATFTIE